MLFEGIVVLIAGTAELHWKLLLIFFGPICLTTVLITIQSKKVIRTQTSLAKAEYKILPIVKLSGLIVVILALSKLSQTIFGQIGLVGLTFLISLFEIHGSIIANVRLHDAGSVSVQFLSILLMISVVASYTSKLFLVFTLGTSALRKQVMHDSLMLFIVLGLSGLVAYSSSG